MLNALRCELLSELYFVLGFTGFRGVSFISLGCELLSELYFVLGFTGIPGIKNNLRGL